MLKEMRPEVAAERAAQPGPLCIRCGQAPAERYEFWYGREAGAPTFGPRLTTPTFTSQTVTHHYAIGGLDGATLCDRCLSRARARRSFKVLVREMFGFPLIGFAAVLFTAAALWVIVADLFGLGAEVSWVWGVAVLGGIVGGTLIVYGLIYAFTSPKDVGERVAIEERKPELVQQGWTQFWTAKEYEKLS